MAIHQKRKASFRGMKTKNICFIMTVFYSTLNVFSGSMNYLSEGALVQPTLSFTTAGSHSSGKTRFNHNFQITDIKTINIKTRLR